MKFGEQPFLQCIFPLSITQCAIVRLGFKIYRVGREWTMSICLTNTKCLNSINIMHKYFASYVGGSCYKIVIEFITCQIEIKIRTLNFWYILYTSTCFVLYNILEKIFQKRCNLPFITNDYLLWLDIWNRQLNSRQDILCGKNALCIDLWLMNIEPYHLRKELNHKN